jgi:3-keto-disaccharide hydrolase/Peptidase of plants and bacteria
MKTFTLLALATLPFTFGASGAVTVLTAHNSNEKAAPAFKFDGVPSPSKTDAATGAAFSIVDGERDENGGELDVLHNGRLPNEEDQPAENFFFNAGTGGGRLLIDLGKVIEVKQLNSYSWHPNTRAPQVYRLYAGDGAAEGFKAKPGHGTEPAGAGWTLVAKVDTRPKEGEPGGQYAVSISDSEGALGKFRYLLFDISATEKEDAFGNTFFSEIDVISDSAASTTVSETPAQPASEVIKMKGYEATLDTSEMPELTEWAHRKLVPMVEEWYPRIVEMLPSEGYEAPKTFSITFLKDMRGVANTSGTKIRCAGTWFKNNLQGEAVGAVFHEMVHVVQQYGRARRTNPGATRAPGWLTEGIPDYIRWFIYEPQTHGAEITRRNISRASYDASYRITANFLNWTTEKYSRDLARTLNAAIREGKYSEDLWKQATGHTVKELGDEWKRNAEERLAALGGDGGETANNALSEAEKQAGWKLLFNGRDLTGWHNFRKPDVLPGWQIKDGNLVCVDPHNAGDLVTEEMFDWFELQLDYNISEGGNSGIMFHVTDQGGSAWNTGPEFQLEDNVKAVDKQRCGWLYALYQPPDDPSTGKPLDATKPAGQWNHVRLVIGRDKCLHEINGVKYFEYVLGSDDFKSRVAKSKFGGMPRFAKSDSGRIALQGDHGQISFRNIKVLPLK